MALGASSSSSLQGRFSLFHCLLVLTAVLNVCGAQTITPSVTVDSSSSEDLLDFMGTDTLSLPVEMTVTVMPSSSAIADTVSFMTSIMATPTPSPMVVTPSPTLDVTSLAPLSTSSLPSSTSLGVTETPTSPPISTTDEIFTTSTPATSGPTTSGPDETTSTSSSTTQSATNLRTTATTAQASSGLSQGAIIGIAAGGGAAVLLLIFFCLCCCCFCFCCGKGSSSDYNTGNEGFRPQIVVRTYNQNVERAGSLISRGSRGSFARSSISSIASSIRSLRRLSGKRRSKNKDSHFVNEDSVAMKVTPL